MNPNGSPIRENVNEDVWPNYDGWNGKGGTSRKKTVSLPNSGDHASPGFTPADFGWPHRPAGRFWFDAKIDRQQHQENSLDTPDRKTGERFGSKTPPVKSLTKNDEKTPVGSKDVLASAMPYIASTAQGRGTVDLRCAGDQGRLDRRQRKRRPFQGTCHRPARPADPRCCQPR
jgi:hypothetical protein